MNEFQTKTENEYLRRTHALTVKVMAFAFVAITLISMSFSGAIIYLAYQQTEQIKIIMSAPVEITREISMDGSTDGNNSPINQTVGK